MKKSNKLPDYF